MYSRIRKIFKNIFKSNAETVVEIESEEEKPSGKTAMTGKLQKIGERIACMCAYREKDSSWNRSEATLQLNAVKMHAEEEAQRFTFQQNVRRAQIKVRNEILQKEAEEEAERFLMQQKQRTEERERWNFLEEEAKKYTEQQKQRKAIAKKRKFDNLLAVVEEEDIFLYQRKLRKPEIQRLKKQLYETQYGYWWHMIKYTFLRKIFVKQILGQRIGTTDREIAESYMRPEIPKEPKKKFTMREHIVPEHYKKRTHYCDSITRIDKGLNQPNAETRVVWKNVPTIDDFQLQSVIGEGVYGMVFKAKYRKTGQMVAMKAISKNCVNKLEYFKAIALEQRILRLARQEKSPFLVGLFCSFRTEEYICLAMEYAEGGDLAPYAIECALSLERTRFYAACVVLGLQFLHEHNIAHRDVKAENIVIDRDGYARLIDFGLCQDEATFDSTTTAYYGTTYSMAPEVLFGALHNKRSVDWWGLGVVIYRFLTGTLPFYGVREDDAVISLSSKEPYYPDTLTEESREIIVNLLKKDPQQRLGYGEHGVEDVKKSPFFKEIDWEALQNKQIQPPFIPTKTAPKFLRQAEKSLNLPPCKDQEPLWEDTQWGVEELDYPVSSDTETD